MEQLGKGYCNELCSVIERLPGAECLRMSQPTWYALVDLMLEELFPDPFHQMYQRNDARKTLAFWNKQVRLDPSVPFMEVLIRDMATEEEFRMYPTWVTSLTPDMIQHLMRSQR